MSTQIARRPAAARDVDGIALYIAEDNPEAAHRFLNAVEIAYHTLAEMPRLGSSRDLGDRDLADLRVWPVPGFRKYLIFYRPTNNGIEVIRVLHGMRDYPTIFSG